MATVPQQIGPYRVLKPIATGGTAEVYEVLDAASGERLALKLLVAVKTSAKRFNREYEAMTRLNHPSIVRVYHYGLHKGHPWLTMELLRGAPAQSFVKRAGKPGSEARTREVLRVAYHVAGALAYIHERKLVHRDLKSANVLVLPDERIKLLDFGAATLLDATDRITIDGEFVGTFAYASPEQVSGKPLDGRSDLYSLGVLLFRLVTGQRPFESDLPEDLIRMHLHATPPDARSVNPGVPEPLARLIDELLQKDPNHRPARAGIVSQRLEKMAGAPFSTRSRLAVHDLHSAPRDVERRLLLDHLQKGPPATIVVVDGEQGSDRTRMLEAIEELVRRDGWVTKTVVFEPQCSLRRLVDTFVALAGDGETGRALSEPILAAAQPEVLRDPKERLVLAQHCAVVARGVALRGTPVLLLAHEVHNADPMALELLVAVAKAVQSQDAPFKIVVSARTLSMESPDWEVGRRLSEAFRVHLPALSQRDVAVAVGNMLGRRPPAAPLARRLHEMSGGQPLYVEQAVENLVNAGGIEADGSRLAWADQAMDLPPPIDALRAASDLLDHLPIIFRRVLEALAIADDATEPPVLARTLGWSTQELREVLEGLVASGVLRWKRGEALLKPEWRQPLFGALVLQQLHPCRRAVLYRTLADAVRRLPPSRGAVCAMVFAGRRAEAARAAVLAATPLVSQGEVRSAVRLLIPVLERVTETDLSPEFAEVYLLHADCLRVIHPTDPANARSLSRARAISEPFGDPVLDARLHLAQARLFAAIGHFANNRKSLRAAWDAKPTDQPGIAAEIATDLATSLRLHGDVPKAETWVQTANGLAESAPLPVKAMVAIEAAACQLARGRLADAEATLFRAMHLCERGDHRPGYWLALARWANVLRHQARFSEALAELYRSLPPASQGEDSTPYIEQLLATGWIELDLCRLGRAQECQDELVATVSRGEHLQLRLESQLLHGKILLVSGHPRNAAYVLQEVQRTARQADLPVAAEHARALHAETLFALGDKDAGTQAYQSAVLGLLGSGDQTMLAEGCRSRARSLAAEQHPDEIFRPAQRLLDEQPMPQLRLERLMARCTWHKARGERDLARLNLNEAAQLLNRLATDLNDTDRSALRVHPWSNWIRRGLGR